MKLPRGPAFRGVFVFLVVGYLLLTFLLPPSQESLARYQISPGTLRLLQVSVALPLIAIWAAGAYGFSRLRDYAQLIGGAKEAKSVEYIAGGLMILALGQPLQSTAAAGLRYLARSNPSLETLTVVSINYLHLVIALSAFLCINYGVRRLVDLKKIRVPALAVHLHIVAFTALSMSYTYFVLRYGFPDGGVSESYRLPLWVVLITLVLPYVYTWSIGLYAAYLMYLYNSKLKGVIYRRGWLLISLGLTAIIATSFFLQYLMTLADQINRLSIAATLVLVYGLLIVMAAGYLLVAFGARRLQKIEEV